MSSIFLTPGQIINKIRSLPSRFLGKDKTPPQLVKHDEQERFIRTKAKTKVNRRGSKCEEQGKHLWRFEFSELDDVTYEPSKKLGHFKCARCGQRQMLSMKHKPHHDKINFRRSDPRHPQYVAAQPLKEAA